MKKRQRQSERQRGCTLGRQWDYSAHHGFIIWGCDPVFSIMFRVALFTLYFTQACPKVHSLALYTSVCVWCYQSSSFCAVAGQAPVISVEPRTATVRQGESVSFRCQVGSGAQPVQLQWKRANNNALPGQEK
ncbi:hypothetical protein INR49_026536 [Caranx melampygus]|nr:hypothetical protein INR49_026536 [Caranx melampygus]